MIRRRRQAETGNHSFFSDHVGPQPGPNATLNW